MPTLKYEQITASLRERIASGDFPPGSFLPSSRDLCEQWEVSRATANKAMDVLRSDGLVIPIQGRGHKVVEQPIGRPAGGRRAGTTRIQGGRPFRRLGSPEMLTPPSHIADCLQLSAGRQALHRARLMLTEGGEPLSHVTAWFPPDIADAAPRLHQSGPLAEGTTHYVRRTTGRGPVRGIDVTTVRLATSAEAAHLRVNRPVAVAVDLHTAYDQNDRPLVCEEGVTPSGLWERVDNYAMRGAS